MQPPRTFHNKGAAVQPLRTLYNKASGYPDVQRRLSFERFEEKKGGFIFGNKIERAKKGRAKSGGLASETIEAAFTYFILFYPVLLVLYQSIWSL
jgi:hypothetical protein